MDAVGIAASVTALITITAQVGKLLSTYISEVRDVPEVLNNLLSEISSLTTVLYNLKQTIDSDVFKNRIEQDLLTGYKGEHWRFVNKAVEDGLKTLRSLESEWDSRSEPHKKRPRLLQIVKTHFTLASEEGRLRSYRLRILTAKDAINISLMTLSVASQIEMQDSVNNLMPRLDEASEKISEVLYVLNERFRNIQLDDDRESINIARRVTETASDILSMASSTVISVSDHTETQSVLFIDPGRQSVVTSWVSNLNSSVNDELVNMDLSRLGLESLFERGMEAYAKNSYGDVEAFLERYLVVGQSEELHEDRDRIVKAYLKLCDACLQQRKMNKMRDNLISAANVVTTATEKALLWMAYGFYYLNEETLDVSEAETVWKNAATCLKSVYGSMEQVDKTLFQQLTDLKLDILRRKDDTIEFQFWSAVMNSNNEAATPNVAQKKPPKSRRLRKPSSSENREIAYAIGKGDLQRIQNFMADNINVSAFQDRTPENSGCHCLHLAVKLGQKELVEFFLQNGADPNQPAGRQLLCPLTFATQIKDKPLAVSIFKILLQKGAIVRTKGQRALHAAILNGNVEIVRMLLEQDPEAHIIVNEGQYTMCKSLYITACVKDDHDQLELVKLLVEKGAHTKDLYLNEYPLFWKFDPSHPSFRYLVESGCVDLKFTHLKTQNSLLHQSYHENFSPPTDLIPWYISKGLDINHVNRAGDTPLISALRHGCYEAASKFIELGCDVNPRGKRSLRSALYFALNDTEENFKTQFLEVASMLLDKGATIAPTDITLHGAIRGRDEQLVERLIKVGVQVDKHEAGESPLTCARNLNPSNERIVMLLERSRAREAK